MKEEHLAWHETLEIHELVAFQSVGLIKLKKGIDNVRDAELRGIYKNAIEGITTNLMELLVFYPDMPREEAERAEPAFSDSFFAGDLLALAKMTVRNYGIAITEAATPEVRKVLQKHLNNAIDLHGKIFNYMYKNSNYPAYNLEKLLNNDIQLARKALK
ncbi:spore coat protein [Evansella sp. AB-P1]|uniref:spore coat protein n=1 Tax=Evansella sp. AB-P1 TaxID=3037653 RepID=UPI00241C02DF|nr:spore coat protein [Evansella sp. AB-P1]MDG5788016.1 spore coat protein [Evansella sp. AB-P1]